MKKLLLTGIAALFLATGTAHAIEKTYDVYCFFTREMEITRRSRDRDGLVVCTYDQKGCERLANRPWKGMKVNPPIKCGAPGKLTLEMPY